MLRWTILATTGAMATLWLAIVDTGAHDKQRPPNMVFVLADDLGEEKDLSQSHSRIASRLQAKLALWRKQVGANVAVHKEAAQ